MACSLCRTLLHVCRIEEPIERRFRKVVTTADRLVAAATRDDRFYGGADSVAEVAATAPADEGDAGFLPKKKGDAGRRRHQLTSRARASNLWRSD